MQFYSKYSNIVLTIQKNISDIDSNVEEDTLSTIIFVAWDKRKERLEYKYTVTAWSLSPLLEICLDVAANFDGETRLIVEHIIEKLH